jgi:hypothetical protein
MIFYITSILVLILGVTLHRKRVKAHNDKFIMRLSCSQENTECPFDDFMCLMLDDGSTIIRRRTFSVKGNASRVN